jgi:hypothetical protein
MYASASKCRIIRYYVEYDILASNVILLSFFSKEMLYYNVKCRIVYTMKIDKYDFFL